MDNIYSTKDFYLACLLKSSNFRFARSEKHSEKTVFFYFEVNDEIKLRQLIDEFINMTAQVNLRKFTWAMSDLRKELDKHRTNKC